jgi:hypothetical protein
MRERQQLFVGKAGVLGVMDQTKCEPSTQGHVDADKTGLLWNEEAMTVVCCRARLADQVWQTRQDEEMQNKVKQGGMRQNKMKHGGLW